MKGNIIDTMLNILNVDHTKSYTEKVYNEHPHKYDMYGLYDLLHSYGVNALGIKISNKDHSNLSFPCILHVNNRFVVATGITDGEISYFWNGKKLEMPLKDFESIWTGNAIVVDGDSEAAEPDIKHHKTTFLIQRIESVAFTVVVALSFVMTIHHNDKSIGAIGFTLLFFDGIGLLVTTLLMEKLLHKEDSYGDKVCSMFHQKDCNGVLESAKSSIFGISWSEIGFSYFLSHMFVIAAFPWTISTLSLLDVLIICYPIWSIYYQWKVAKQWCILCVSVQCILAAECLLGIVCLMHYEVIIELSGLCLFGMAFYALLFIIHKYVEGCKSKEENTSNLQKLKALKANQEVFHTLLTQEKYTEGTNEVSSIVFGNPNAHIKVTILTNPHCEPCARMHKRIERLLENKKNKVCVQYIFSAFNESLENSNRFLIAVYQQLGAKDAWNIYTDWYSHGKYHVNDFMKQFQDIRMDIPSVFKESDRHLRWRKKSGYMATPTILVNGYELPSEYEVSDLKMLV